MKKIKPQKYYFWGEAHFFISFDSCRVRFCVAFLSISLSIVCPSGIEMKRLYVIQRLKYGLDHFMSAIELFFDCISVFLNRFKCNRFRSFYNLFNFFFKGSELFFYFLFKFPFILFIGRPKTKFLSLFFSAVLRPTICPTIKNFS